MRSESSRRFFDLEGVCKRVSKATGRLWAPDFPFAPSKVPVFYGWIIVFAASVGTVFSIPGQTMGFSVFTEILIEELGLSRVQLSTAYCIGTVLSGFTLPSLGRLFDRLGARRMIVYAAIVTGLVLVYLSQCRNILDVISEAAPFLGRGVIAFGVICLGFYMIRASAQGVLTMTSRNVMGKWFDYHRGLALAISGTVTSFAFSISPRFLDALIDRFGWSGAWMVLALLTLTVMVLLGWLLYRDNPEECGLVMDGSAAGRKEHDHNPDMMISRDYTRREALRTPSFWIFNLSFAFLSLFYTAFTFHLLSIAGEAGIEKKTILSLFVPMAVISVFSNLFCGWINSRTRLKYLLFILNLAAFLSVIGLVYLGARWGMILYVAGNGISGGFFASLIGIVWPRFFGRTWLGAISGVGMSSMVITSGIGPLLFSASMAWFQGYTPVLWLSAVIPAALMIASWRADNPQRFLEPS